ncbi:MAG: class I SAM-dependent methyltransferase [Anaerolineae bacterium]|jgi:SAM-dependent methyltransferase
MNGHLSGYERSAHLYDLFDSKENVDFFGHYAALVGEILDIGAGTGRVAMPLAERGIRLVCVEPSPAMRDVFEKKLDRRPDLRDRITLVPCDAASFHLERTFRAAFLSGTFDHFLDPAERLSSLQNIARHLGPGGILVFDVFLGLMDDSPLTPAGRVQRADREYRRLVGRRAVSGHQVQVQLIFEIYENDELVERIEQQSIAGIVDRGQVHDLLAQVGFSVRGEFSDYDFTPYRAGDELLIVDAVHQFGDMRRRGG